MRSLQENQLQQKDYTRHEGEIGNSCQSQGKKKSKEKQETSKRSRKTHETHVNRNLEDVFEGSFELRLKRR